jgi:hypothetical protein
MYDDMEELKRRVDFLTKENENLKFVYMDKLLDLVNLSQHIKYYVEREQLPNGSWPLLREAS